MDSFYERPVMAKKRRYHQSVKDRMAESRGMERYETRAMERAEHRSKKMDNGYYAGMDPRRRQEMEDAGMIHEDHRAVANLPQNAIMKEYPRPYYDNNYNLDDTIRGIDNQINDDMRKEKKERFPEKY